VQSFIRDLHRCLADLEVAEYRLDQGLKAWRLVARYLNTDERPLGVAVSIRGVYHGWTHGVDR